MLSTEAGVEIARLEPGVGSVTFNVTDDQGNATTGTLSWDNGAVLFEVGWYKVLHMQAGAADAFGPRFALIRDGDAVVVVETHRYRATAAQEKP